MLVLLWMPVLAAAAQTRTLLVVGDSISAGFGLETGQGWVPLLAERLQEEHPGYQVVNASISGETTAGGRSRLPALLETHRPAVVILELGGNDGLRGLAPANMKQNLAAMIGQARDEGARVLLAGIRLPPNLGPVFLRLHRQAFASLAEETGVAFVPFLLQGIADVPALMQADGVHPKAEAQPLLLQNVWEKLVPLLQ